MGWLPRFTNDVARKQVQRDPIGTAEQSIPIRPSSATSGSVFVDQESALRHSGVWAAQRLRANLISSLPLRVMRSSANGETVTLKSPNVLVNPDGDPKSGIDEWLWATQFDLDRFGNAFGGIGAWDGLGYPAQIELLPVQQVAIKTRTSSTGAVQIMSYRINGHLYDPREIWHERQYRVAGIPMGLSPLAYAAWSIGGFLSALRFGLDYFGAGGMPSGVLRNNELQIVDTVKSDEIKRRFKASVEGHDIFVTGRDWEWTPVSVENAAQAFIESQRFGLNDVARYFDVPADLIDASTPGSSVTYANISQRNLQLLVMSLGPAINRRERSLSKLTPAPHYVLLDGDALLRMDPETRVRTNLAKVATRTLGVNEYRRMVENLGPMPQEEIDLLTTLLPAKVIQPKVVTSA